MITRHFLFSISLLVSLWLLAAVPTASAYFKPLPPPAKATLTLRSLEGWPSWIGRLGESDLPSSLVVTGGALQNNWPSWIGRIPWLQ